MRAHRFVIKVVFALAVAAFFAAFVPFAVRVSRALPIDFNPRHPVPPPSGPFSVGLQGSNAGYPPTTGVNQCGLKNVGDVASVFFSTSTGVRWSGWASNGNFYNPDCFRTSLGLLGKWSDAREQVKNTDFRLLLQASDAQSGLYGCGGEMAAEQATPWASENGGWSWWVTDSNATDPNCFRVGIETRAMPSGKVLNDFRIGLQASDIQCTSEFGDIVWTPLGSAGGGWSDWAHDTNLFQPDCYRVGLDAVVGSAGTVTPSGLGTIVVNSADKDGSPVNSSWSFAITPTAVNPCSPSCSGSYKEYTGMASGTYSMRALSADGYTFNRICGAVGSGPTVCASSGTDNLSLTVLPEGEISFSIFWDKQQTTTTTPNPTSTSTPALGLSFSDSYVKNGGNFKIIITGYKGTLDHLYINNNGKGYEDMGKWSPTCDSPQTGDRCVESTTVDCAKDSTIPANLKHSLVTQNAYISYDASGGAATTTSNTATIQKDCRTGGSLSCSDVPFVAVGVAATVAAAGGSGQYSWSAPGGSPSVCPDAQGGSASCPDNRFSTSYGSAGQKTITVRSGGNSGICTVNVIGNPQVSPACSFSAKPSTISKGQSSALWWECNTPVSCAIRGATSTIYTDPDGYYNTVGTTQVSPAKTTTYDFTCLVSADGLITGNATVTVITATSTIIEIPP